MRFAVVCRSGRQRQLYRTQTLTTNTAAGMWVPKRALCRSGYYPLYNFYVTRLRKYF